MKYFKNKIMVMKHSPETWRVMVEGWPVPGRSVAVVVRVAWPGVGVPSA